ncbi:HAT1-interacting factor 1 [Fonsecaea monophora]|uniref:HAT1-interacting factor 1 n=1 Tax=Fonsecaea monophora TaxID=254056 RepID=A0A177FF58_9EURO|nr:HAT1-interacting factor 1 [Fonsecaea monophora]KAH0843127.1 short chain dehydrogenase [Fonsecaea pedrosoi]OAG42250.1 HAT1-interacting factor 1 [Fonsecaea monophora]
MASRIVLITGANTGLGLEIVRALYRSESSSTILCGSRSLDKASAALKALQADKPKNPQTTVEPIQIDIEDDNSINSAFDNVENTHGHIDCLVNNAGIALDQAFLAGKISQREAWDKAYSVNVTSTHVMTYKFAPLLIKSSDPRLIFIGSGTASLARQVALKSPIDHSPPKGWPKPIIGQCAYRTSKTALTMVMREWARILKEDGVRVFACSPGMLATNLGGSPEQLKAYGALDPSIGGGFVKDVIEGKRDADAGKAIDKTGVQDW